MAGVLSYRQIAEKTLDQAAAEIGKLPTGSTPTDIVIANSARVQALATVAAVQALLEIGDVLREHLRRGDA